MRRGSLKLESKELKILNNELRREMEEIRSSIEGKILKAWAEVEELHDEREELLDINSRLLHQLQLAKAKEESLLKQLRNIQTDDIQTDDSQTGSSRSKNNDNAKWPIVNIRSLLTVKDKNPKTSCERTIDTADTTDSETSFFKNHETYNQKPESDEASSRTEKSNFGMFGWPPIEKSSCSKSKRVEKEKSELISKLQCKLKGREIVSDSLEQTSFQQEENLKILQNQIIEQNADARSREQAQRRQMTELECRIEGKGKLIAKQEQRIKKYLDYIECLSSELRQVVVEQNLLSSDPTGTRGKSILTTVKLQTELLASA